MEYSDPGISARVDFYRFSISWPRILPNGTTDYINQAGIDYYNRMIDQLLANGIEPLVTVYHWDLPKALENVGGWLNPNITKYFTDYADLVFSTFGDRVTKWVTINEALSAALGYGSAQLAPGYAHLHGTGEYQAAHNLLRAHAKTYRLYQQKYNRGEGKLGMTFIGSTCLPLTNKPEDIAAADRCYQFAYGWFAHPIFVGDYPPVMREEVNRECQKEGRNESRLPYFTAEEIEEIKGSSDFFGLNYYDTKIAENGVGPSNVKRSWTVDEDAKYITRQHPTWDNSPLWQIYPPGIRILAKQVKENYGNPLIYVLETGYPGPEDEGLNDDKRVAFYDNHLREVRKAIYEDGCRIEMFTAWSLIDNFEWSDGYGIKFGLVHVDYNSPNRTRTIKKSGKWYKNYINFQKDSEQSA